MSTIKANTLLHSDGSTTNPPAIPALDKRMATAWVNFNGENTVAIQDSENVSSITDQDTGKYQVNFATAMANVNYAPQWTINNNVNQIWVQGLTTTTMQTRVYNGSSYQDVSGCYVVIMGGRA